MNNKVETYIGFAIRKGSAVFGCDSIRVYRKKVYLLLYTPSLSQNSLSDLTKSAQRIGCPVLQVDEYETLQKKNCKAIAICDKSLATAIVENLK